MRAEKRFPDIIILAPARSGANALYRALVSLSLVARCPTTEPGVLLADRIVDYSVHQTYEGLYRLEGRSEKLALDCTPFYFMFPRDIATRSALVGLPSATRFIVILRTPSERLLAGYRYSKRRGFIPQNATFDDFLVRCEYFDPETADSLTQLTYAYLYENRYAEHLAAHLDTFGDDRVYVLPYSRLFEDGFVNVPLICRMLGVAGRLYPIAMPAGRSGAARVDTDDSAPVPGSLLHTFLAPRDEAKSTPQRIYRRVDEKPDSVTFLSRRARRRLAEMDRQEAALLEELTARRSGIRARATF